MVEPLNKKASSQMPTQEHILTTSYQPALARLGANIRPLDEDDDLVFEVPPDPIKYWVAIQPTDPEYFQMTTAIPREVFAPTLTEEVVSEVSQRVKMVFGALAGPIIVLRAEAVLAGPDQLIDPNLLAAVLPRYLTAFRHFIQQIKLESDALMPAADTA